MSRRMCLIRMIRRDPTSDDPERGKICLWYDHFADPIKCYSDQIAARISESILMQALELPLGGPLLRLELSC